MSLFLYNALNTLLLKNANYHLTMQGCHQPSILKKNPAISAKHSKVRHSTARYACVQVFSSKGKVKLEALGVNPYFVFRL